ncbi:hypothetical protein BCR42DRAFT_59446 [Absidia repens]|uniref:PH domain-containing protein n=1 Tax=Absidia repens TaxID=90262 RepID=A0A1X2ICH4_9FUNG|nr:hypothetical protein BCR42DRAFT_59446 [Absidia repens]
MMNSQQQQQQQQQQTPQPTRSTPLHQSPFTRPSTTPMLPTPSSSRSSTLTQEQLRQLKLDFEQQLMEREQQCQDCGSGIQKNVLTRQISQLRDKLGELEQQIQLQQQDRQDDGLPPATVDKIRHLERDLATYRGQQRKDKLLPQRGLDILPSPSTSTLMPNAVPSSLLPLPPPPSGSTPTKRRSKIPNNDRRNTDIEFATEIGQGLLIEVRKMQAILQEKEEQLRALEIQKADLERSAEAMAKQLRQREENEEKLKEETWNLELTKQELTLSVTELQQHLHKATSEQTKLAKQTNDLRSDIEQLRDREEKLTALLETSKQRHEQDMTSLRRHCAGLQREAQQHTKHIDTLTSELAIAKAQSRLGKHQSAAPGSNNTAGQLSSDDSDPSDPSVMQDSVHPQYRSGGSSSNSPPSSPKQQPVAGGGRAVQAMEVETLKTSLAHAHRMVSNLRSHLHKEKTEKFEFKKLLAESQETIEQLQNDPQLWVDAPRSSSHQGGSSGGVLDDPKKRKVKQHRRATRKLHRGGGAGGAGNSNGMGGGTSTPPLSSSRSGSKRQGGDGDNDSLDDDDDDDDDAYSYSSVSDDNDDVHEGTNTPPPAGFTSLSLELSQSNAKLNNTSMEMGVMTDDILIIHDRHHYEQQLAKLHQLEQWHQASLDKAKQWTMVTQQPCMDQAPVVLSETPTQTNDATSPLDAAALQSSAPASVHQECQCDLIEPRDEAAEALAIAKAKQEATEEAEAKSAKAANEAKAAAAIALSAAVAAATAKAHAESTKAEAEATEAAVIAAKTEAEANAAKAIEAAVAEATAKTVAEAHAESSKAADEANSKAAANLAAAVEAAKVEAEIKASAAIEAAVAEATAKTMAEAHAESTKAADEANSKAAANLAAAVEAAKVEAETKASAATEAAVAEATAKAKEEALAKSTKAAEESDVKAAAILTAAVEAARSEAENKASAALTAAVEAARSEAETQTSAAIEAAVAEATAKAKAEAHAESTKAAEESDVKAAANLAAAVEAAKVEAETKASAAIEAVVAEATAKAKAEAHAESAKAAEESDVKAAATLAAAVEAAKVEAETKASAAIEAAVAEATAKAKAEAHAESTKAAEESDVKAAATLAAAVEAAKVEAEAKATIAIEAAVAEATTMADAASTKALDEANAKAATALAAAVEAAKNESDVKAAAAVATAVAAAVAQTKNDADAQSIHAVADAEAKATLAMNEAVDVATKQIEAKAAASLAAAVAEATAKAKQEAADDAKSTTEAAVAAARSDVEAKSAAALSTAVLAAIAKTKEELAIEQANVATVDQGTQCDDIPTNDGVEAATQVDPISAMDASVQHEYTMVDSAAQHDYIPVDASVQHEYTTIDSAVQHEYTTMDSAVQHEYSAVDQHTQHDTVIPTSDSATQHEPVTTTKDVSTQYENTTVESAEAPMTVDVGGVGTDMAIQVDTPVGELSDCGLRGERVTMAHSTKDAYTRQENGSTGISSDNSNAWLGSLNDSGPNTLDRSLNLASTQSQKESDATVSKAVVDANTVQHDQHTINNTTSLLATVDKSRNDSDDRNKALPARPTQRPPSSLLDKATRNGSGIMAASTATTDYLDDSSSSSGLKRQVSLSVSSMATESNQATYHPSNTVNHGASSSASSAGMTAPSITSSIHDEHSTMVRALPKTADPTISSITQTMIGDWLVKYTRKPMGQGFSERRHERYFWIHPYTRTLYWCTRAPGADGGELKAKSAFVENVMVGRPDSDSPEGSGVPCLLIQTATRQLKIKAPTKERHDLWFESLTYLLTRTGQSTFEPTPSILPQRSISASILRKPSIQRINDVYHRTVSTSSHSQDNQQLQQQHHHHHHHHDHDDDDDDDEALENVRLCCGGKHDVGRLVKDHNHRPAYHQRKQ